VLCDDLVERRLLRSPPLVAAVTAVPTCGRTLDRVGVAFRTATIGAPGHARETCSAR